ncbi:MAG: metallophosphoesterase [Lentisphaerae bacterium]|nr:metallophosphoesterase [Lentisphaerota bacterium]
MVGCCGLCAYKPSHVENSLVVLHTNDHHGHPLAFFDNTCPEQGGLPARATLVNDVRGEFQNVLVLDAGDLNTGRPESNYFKAKPDIQGYNYIKYDAMAIGNHEFDLNMTWEKRGKKGTLFIYLYLQPAKILLEIRHAKTCQNRCTGCAASHYCPRYRAE